MTSTSDMPTYEEAIARLEGIVRKLQDGKTDLETALSQYEEGVRLLRHCHGLLEGAQRRIETLRSLDANGMPVTSVVEEHEVRTQ